MRRALALSLAALAIVAARSARADPPSRVVVRLDYLRGPGAESCPATDAPLRDDVTHLMGYDPFNADASERLAVVVARQARGWAATLTRFEAGGTPWSTTFRRESASECAAFMAQLASATRGWLLQGAPGTLPASGRLFGLDGFDPPVRGPAPVLVAPPEPQRDSAQPAPSPQSAKRLELAAMANLVGSGEPAVTGGATLRAALRWTWLSAGAELRFDAPAGAGASGIVGAPAAHYDGTLIAGALAPCAVYEGASVQPFGCAVVLGGAMTETGSGIKMPGTDTHFLLAAGPRVGLDIPFHVPRVGLALRASFDGLFFPVGARFHLDGSEVWKTPPFSAVGSLGLAVFL